jgi:hypothetical protein
MSFTIFHIKIHVQSFVGCGRQAEIQMCSALCYKAEHHSREGTIIEMCMKVKLQLKYICKRIIHTAIACYLPLAKYILFFNFGLRGFCQCGHSWPIVPALGDSEDDCGEVD